MTATGSYLNDILKEGPVCGEDILRELIKEKCSPQSASTNVHIGDRKILVGNSSPSPFEEREREDGSSPSCLADIAEGNVYIPDLIKEEIRGDMEDSNVFDHEGFSNLKDFENVRDLNDHLESSSGSGESCCNVLPTASNSSGMSNSNSYDLESCIKECSQLSYDYDGDTNFPTKCVPGNGSVTPSDEDLIIEAIMNEVKDDPLFASLNSNEAESPSNAHMSGLESYEVNDFGEVPKADSLTLAGGSDFSRSHDIEENNDACSDEVEGVKDNFKCLSGTDNFEIENSSLLSDVSVSGTVENNDQFNNKDEVDVKEMSDNPFGNVANDSCAETFCDLEEPFKTDEKGKESSKPKSKGGTKKGKDGKRITSNGPIIDEDVLNEVKSLLDKHQSSNSTGHITSSLEKAEKCTDPVLTKTKEKKKKKKTKRSNSKTDTSLISLAEESTSPTQRRILKRGTIWKEKRDKEGTSPIPSEDREKLSSENEYQVLERDVGEDQEVLHSHVSSNEKFACNEEETLSNNTPTEANSYNEVNQSVPSTKETECDVPVSIIEESQLSVLVGDKCDGDIAHEKNENSNPPTISVDKEVESSTESKEVHLVVEECVCFEGTNNLNCKALDTNKEEASCILSDPSNRLVNSFDVSNEYRSLNDSEVFTFNTTLSIVKPLKPCIEIVSDNSSPISTRSSSMDREVLPTSLTKPSYDGEVIIEDNCLEDVCVPPLFDHVEASKLDGTNRLALNYKKRHSLTKNKILEKKNFSCDSFSSPGMAECIDSSVSRTSPNEHDVSHYYKGAGDPMYNEHCQCSLEEDSKIGVNVSGLELARRGEGATERNQVPSDDSDDTDTWHPKNIKEKIQRIIGARLQPAPDRLVLKEPHNDAKEEDSLALRTSPHSTSKAMNETQDCSQVSKKPTMNESPDVIDGDDTQHTLLCSDGEGGEEENDEGKYQQKLSFNSKHLNLTYLTDSDEPPVHEVSHEDILMLESLRAVEKNEDEPVNSIVQRWETLQSKAVERQRQSTQLRQLQRQVKTLRLNMEGVLNRCSTFAHAHTLDDPSQIGRKVEEVKALLEETENLRSDTSDLNVMVHRFTSEVGSSFTPLKDEMAELYRLWDETHRRVNAELSSLQSAEATWRLWEEQKAEFSQVIKQDSEMLKVVDAAIDNGGLTETVTASVHDVAKLYNEKRIPNANKSKNQAFSVELLASGEMMFKTKADVDGKDDRLSDSGTSGYESCSSDDLTERERRLAYLRRLAKDLEASLVPGSKAWNEIVSTLTEAEKDLQGLQDHCKRVILRTAETLDTSSTPLRFSSNSKRRNWARESKSSRSPRMERRAKSGNLRRQWIRRVVWAALPFQAALLLMLCVACLLEPNCCDSVNTLNLSFTPQLRFVHGSPPV